MTIIKLINLAGLGLSIYGTYLLSKNIFISDEEISELSGLPIEESSTNLTSKEDPNTSKPLAVIPIGRLKKFRETLISNRRQTRSEGKKGFCYIMFGFALQIIAVLLN